MEHLSQKDFHRLLDAILVINAARNTGDFIKAVHSSFSSLVPVDAATYTEVGTPDQLSKVEWTIEEAKAQSLIPALDRYMHEHSFFPHIMKTGDLRARHMQDDLSMNTWKKRSLYNEFYRVVGIEDMTGFGLTSQPLRIIGGFRAPRSKRFSERDRLVMNLFRPHAIQAHESMAAWTGVLAASITYDRALGFLRRGIAEVMPPDTIKFASTVASQWLIEYFGLSKKLPKRLPASLSQWIEAHDPKAVDGNDVPIPDSPYIVERGVKQLTIRCLRNAPSWILLFEERSTIPPSDALKTLGLTKRQTEILGWIALGKTNPEIGMILGLSPRTVQKHIEFVYQQLGIENRAAAVAVALKCLQDTPLSS